MKGSVGCGAVKKWTYCVFHVTNPIINILYQHSIDDSNLADLDRFIHNLDNLRDDLCNVPDDRRDTNYIKAVKIFNEQLSEIKSNSYPHIHVDIEPIDI